MTERALTVLTDPAVMDKLVADLSAAADDENKVDRLIERMLGADLSAAADDESMGNGNLYAAAAATIDALRARLAEVERERDEAVQRARRAEAERDVWKADALARAAQAGDADG